MQYSTCQYSVLCTHSALTHYAVYASAFTVTAPQAL